VVNGRGEAKQDKMYVQRGARWVQSGALRHKTCDRTVVSLVALQNVNEAELGKANEAKKEVGMILVRYRRHVQNKGFVQEHCRGLV
jgi:hypothetical protein